MKPRATPGTACCCICIHISWYIPTLVHVQFLTHFHSNYTFHQFSKHLFMSAKVATVNMIANQSVNQSISWSIQFQYYVYVSTRHFCHRSSPKEPLIELAPGAGGGRRGEWQLAINWINADIKRAAAAFKEEEENAPVTSKVVESKFRTLLIRMSISSNIYTDMYIYIQCLDHFVQ